LIIPFYFIFRRIHEFGILYSFNKSTKRLEQKREELKRKYKELKKVFGYEKVATVNEKNAIKKNTECIKLLQAKLIIENRMRGCMEENYFLDQRKINRQIQLVDETLEMVEHEFKCGIYEHIIPRKCPHSKLWE